MDHKQQTEHFAHRLNNLIDYCSKEYNLTYAQIIGVMQIKMIEMILESNEEGKHEDE